MKIGIIDNKHHGLVRDTDNRSLVESDKSKMNDYETKRNMMLTTIENKKNITKIETDMSVLKTDMSIIKNILLGLSEKK